MLVVSVELGLMLRIDALYGCSRLGVCVFFLSCFPWTTNGHPYALVRGVMGVTFVGASLPRYHAHAAT